MSSELRRCCKQPPAPPPAQFPVAVCFAAFRGCSSVPLAVPVCVCVCMSMCVPVCAFVCINFGLACNWRETLWIPFVLAPRSLTTFCVFYCSADLCRQSKRGMRLCHKYTINNTQFCWLNLLKWSFYCKLITSLA